MPKNCRKIEKRTALHIQSQILWSDILLTRNIGKLFCLKEIDPYFVRFFINHKSALCNYYTKINTKHLDGNFQTAG